MPFIEFGKTYAFQTPTEIPLNYKLLNALTGFVGNQSQGGVTNVNLNATDLASVATVVEANTGAKVLYAKLSWNETQVGSSYSITDCVFGIVYYTYREVDAQQVFYALPANLRQAFIDLQMVARGDFKAYLDGTSSYSHIWDWAGDSGTEVTVARSISGMPVDPFPTDQIKTTCEVAILARCKTELENQLAVYQPTVTLIEPLVTITTTSQSRQYRDYTETTFYHTLSMSARVHFTTVKPLTSGVNTFPLDPISWAFLVAALTRIIKYIIIGIVAGVVIYYTSIAFINAFFVKESKVTTSTTITTKKPVIGADGKPVTDANGNVVYDETTTTTTTTQDTKEPNPLSIELVALAVIVLGGLAIYFKMGQKK